MRHIMIFVLFFMVGLNIPNIIKVYGAEAPKKDDLICVTNEVLDKTMVEKGFDVLLTMKNEDGVVESVWTGGQSISITAAVPNENKSCLMAIMRDVTFNPKVIEDVWETYKKQTKQKDI